MKNQNILVSVYILILKISLLNRYEVWATVPDFGMAHTTLCRYALRKCSIIFHYRKKQILLRSNNKLVISLFLNSKEAALYF